MIDPLVKVREYDQVIHAETTELASNWEDSSIQKTVKEDVVVQIFLRAYYSEMVPVELPVFETYYYYECADNLIVNIKAKMRVRRVESQG